MLKNVRSCAERTPVCEAAAVLFCFMAGTCFDNHLPQQRGGRKNLLHLVGVLAENREVSYSLSEALSAIIILF